MYCKIASAMRYPWYIFIYIYICYTHAQLGKTVLWSLSSSDPAPFRESFGEEKEDFQEQFLGSNCGCHGIQPCIEQSWLGMDQRTLYTEYLPSTKWVDTHANQGSYDLLFVVQPPGVLMTFWGQQAAQQPVRQCVGTFVSKIIKIEYHC